MEIAYDLLRNGGHSHKRALALLCIPASTWHYRYHSRPKRPPVRQADASWAGLRISDEDVAEIQRLIQAGRKKKQSVRSIWFAHLDSDAPLLASLRTFYRIARALAPASAAKRRTNARLTSEAPVLCASRPGQILCWDVTHLPGSMFHQGYCLYTVIDLYSRLIVGWTIQHREDGAIAVKLIENVIDEQASNNNPVEIVHSDNGKIMTSTAMGNMLAAHEVIQSLIRPHVSDDNAFEESSHKTVKYHRFALSIYPTIEDARRVIGEIITCYNTTDPHTGIGNYTPQSVYDGTWEKIHDHRKEKLNTYYQQHPCRRPPRDFLRKPPTHVTLNMSHEQLLQNT